MTSDLEKEAREAAGRRYSANDIRLWMMARGYLTIEQHNDFGRHLPTSNMGHCMGDLADAIDEIASLRAALDAGDAKGDAEVAELREKCEELRMKWISVNDKLPRCPRDERSPGTEVLIWPRAEHSVTAVYGRRATGYPAFYMYGAQIHGVTHWMPLPKGP